MGDFTYVAKADIHCVYSSANGNGRAALRMYHEQFPDGRMRNHILRPLHRQKVLFTSPDMMLVYKQLYPV
ncbi:hypothetical protein CEXT_466161 [Caerostris extrusa]|uniref:DUF4817 domain-containing protein n=1 Tax=Caerostris extrusa TaxID=172846 RepID=A0AAV4WTJ8_CAEEX|nr:hypothetical protein CEXT_466161 [Caerostris extrusa]